MKPNRDEISMDITASASDFMTALRYHLSFIELHISPFLTTDIFETLAIRIDKLLIAEVRQELICCWVCQSHTQALGMRLLGLYA